MYLHFSFHGDTPTQLFPLSTSFAFATQTIWDQWNNPGSQIQMDVWLPNAPFVLLTAISTTCSFHYRELIASFPRAAVMMTNLASQISHNWQTPLTTSGYGPGRWRLHQRAIKKQKSEHLSGPMLPTLQNCLVLQYREKQTATFYTNSWNTFYFSWH